MRMLLIIYLLSMVLGALGFQIIAAEEHNNSSLQEQRLALELQKLTLEIDNLQHEKERKTVFLLSKIIGSVIGIVTVGWTIIKGLKTISEKTKESRQNRIAGLLQDLSSDKLAQKLGAIRAMSQYVDYVIPELLAASATESSIIVKTNFEDTLYLAGEVAREKILLANSNTLIKRVSLGAKIRAIGIENPKFSALEGISVETFDFIRKSFKDDYEHSLALERLLIGRAGKTSSAVEKEVKLLEESIHYERQMAEITRSVVAKWLKNSYKIATPSVGLDLSESNLYNVKFPRMKCRCLIAQRALMRHCSIQYSQVKCSVFNNANMFDSNISNTDFSYSIFKNTNLRLAKSIKSRFDHCDFKGAVLSESDFRNSYFVNASCKFTEFRGTKLQKTNFSKAVLNRAKFHNANLKFSKLNDADFRGAALIQANLCNIVGRGAKFNGADLRGAKFCDADLRGADFRGAVIADTDFRGSDLSGANFEDTKRKEEAIFA